MSKRSWYSPELEERAVRMVFEHASENDSQWAAIRSVAEKIGCSPRLADAGIEPSVGSVEDSYDNELAETIIGLYKAEVIEHRGPWRTFESMEFATVRWVDWFNNRRLLGPIGYVPPTEYEEMFYRDQEEQAKVAGVN
jgi:putative transposase